MTVKRLLARVSAIVAISIAVGFLSLAIAEWLVGTFGTLPTRVRIQTNPTALPSARAAAPRTELHGIQEVANSLYIATPTGRRLRPNTIATIENHPTSKRDVVFQTNSIGYRGAELGEKTRTRVLFLGDSITAGDFLGEQDTFVHIVGRLSEQTSQPLETINAGVGAIGLETELAILVETGLSIAPDIVVLGFYLNDVQDSPGVYPLRLPSFLSWSRIAAHIAYLLPSLFVAEQSDRVERKNWKLEVEKRYPPAKGDPLTDRRAFNRRMLIEFRDWGNAWSTGAWERMNPTFQEFARLGEAHGFGLLIVGFPVRMQVEAEFIANEPQRQLAVVSKQIGVPLLDTLPLLRAAHAESEEPLFYDHVHHTPYGQELLAKAIFEFIRANTGGAR